MTASRHSSTSSGDRQQEAAAPPLPLPEGAAPRGEPPLGAYRGIDGHWDEAIDGKGAVRPAWRRLLSAALAQTPQEAQTQQDLCRRLLKDFGVTYNSPDAGRLPATDEPARLWQLDSCPLIVAADEWRRIHLAVAQRAKLLNAILADVYGPRKLLASGELPPEIVLANPAFLRAAAGVTPLGQSHLNLYAVDLARAPSGDWWIVGDRSDTPAGAGYALENRIVCRRVLPALMRDYQVERLARFFAQFRDSLLAQASALVAARGGEGDPRVVILTPGPYHATYFEQVYLARYLGFHLVEGEDLTVRDQGVFMKTLSGLLPVDVIVRRVSSDYCDPLELRDDSLLGAPGLLQAARAGKVIVANAIGAGVAESPALLPFLPGLCRRLLGEELLMPPVATWWCGQEPALAEVLGNLDRLVVKQAFPSREAPLWLPGGRSSAEAREKILENPHLYVGQEFVALSTAPSWRDGRLAPRHWMIRVYAAALGNGEYAVMPGGLTRAADSAASVLLGSRSGGGGKDTWVLAHSQPDATTLLPTSDRVAALSRAGFVLSSRLADNLFWLGRYMERIEFACRLARCVLHRLTDETEQAPVAPLVFLMEVLADHGRIAPQEFPQARGGRVGEAGRIAASEWIAQMLAAAVFDERNADGMRGDVARVSRIADTVRDRLSHDAWRALHALPEAAAVSLPASPSEQLAALDDLLALLMGFSGQAMEGMTRDKGWRFLDIGRRLERAVDLCDLLRHALVRPSEDESAALAAVLEIANSAMTYRSRYVFEPQAAPVLDLLLADEGNPRSAAFQLSALYQHARSLRDKADGGEVHKSRELRIVQAAFSAIRLIDVDALATLKQRGRRVELASVLRRIRRSMEELSRALTRLYLTHVQTARPLSGGERG